MYGWSSTRVDFANIQDFDRFGMQILQQAHLASMCMATPPTAPPVNLQMMQSQFSSATSLMPAPNMSMMNLSSNQLMLPASGSMQPVVQSSSALQVATGVRPYVPRPVSNPMLQHSMKQPEESSAGCENHRDHKIKKIRDPGSPRPECLQPGALAGALDPPCRSTLDFFGFFRFWFFGFFEKAQKLKNKKTF